MQISNGNNEEFGTPENRCLQVRLVAGRWIVEDPYGEALTEAATREEAILQARQLAVLHRSSEISVQAGEGKLGMTLEV